MLNLHPRSHVTQDYQDLHWLTVDQQNHFKILTITFKCIHCLAPSPLAVKVRLSSPLDMLLDSSQFYPTSSLGKKSLLILCPVLLERPSSILMCYPLLGNFQSSPQTPLVHQLFFLQTRCWSLHLIISSLISLLSHSLTVTLVFHLISSLSYFHFLLFSYALFGSCCAKVRLVLAHWFKPLCAL